MTGVAKRLPAVRDSRTPRELNRPRPGFFRMRLTKGGVDVGACIRHEPTRDPDTGEALDRPWLWSGEIDGKPDPEPAPEPSTTVLRIWEGAEPCSEADYRYLTERNRWARDYSPAAPEARPREPVDLFESPVLF